MVMCLHADISFMPAAPPAFMPGGLCMPHTDLANPLSGKQQTLLSASTKPEAQALSLVV